MRMTLALAALVATTACDPVRTSAVVTKTRSPWAGSVTLSKTAPADGEQVAVVTAVGVDLEVAEIVDGFADKVASVGGNVGVIDSIETKRELVTRTNSTVAPCGDRRTTYKTCTGYDPTYTKEQATTVVTGRAFRK